jgi:hypothetical protein
MNQTDLSMHSGAVRCVCLGEQSMHPLKLTRNFSLSFCRVFVNDICTILFI